MSYKDTTQDSGVRIIAERPKTVTEDNFQRVVLENPQTVLVDFWADWCNPCHAIAPVIDELAREFTGYATVAKVNVDENKSLAEKYNIRSIPTILVFQDGEVVDQVVGTVSRQVLIEKLNIYTETA